MKVYAIFLDGDGPTCPHDERFEHRFYFGCVPKTFSERTGRAKGIRQAQRDDGKWYWDGGCDAAGVCNKCGSAEPRPGCIRCAPRSAETLVINLDMGAAR